MFYLYFLYSTLQCLNYIKTSEHVALCRSDKVIIELVSQFRRGSVIVNIYTIQWFACFLIHSLISQNKDFLTCISFACCKALAASSVSFIALGAAFLRGIVGVDIGVEGLLPISLPANRGEVQLQ